MWILIMDRAWIIRFGNIGAKKKKKNTIVWPLSESIIVELWDCPERLRARFWTQSNRNEEIDPLWTNPFVSIKVIILLDYGRISNV